MFVFLVARVSQCAFLSGQMVSKDPQHWIMCELKTLFGVLISTLCICSRWQYLYELTKNRSWRERKCFCWWFQSVGRYNIVFFLLTYVFPMIVMAVCYSQMGSYLSRWWIWPLEEVFSWSSKSDMKRKGTQGW